MSNFSPLTMAAAKAVSSGSGGSGTSNYEALSNLPKINGVALTGDKSTSDIKIIDFTDTDGTSSGTSGLVPAPSSSDKNYFLTTSGWKSLKDTTTDKVSTFSFSSVEKTDLQ